MTDPFAVLGLPPDADDEAIRQRYLELTRQFPPEHHPDRFAAVRAAYELVKSVDARARFRLFDPAADGLLDALIEDVACRTPRPRPGLTTLLKAALSPPPPPAR